MLIDKYGYTRAKSLIGHLELRQVMIREQMIEQGASQRTIENDEKLILDAAVSLTVTKENMTLPPLSVVF